MNESVNSFVPDEDTPAWLRKWNPSAEMSPDDWARNDAQIAHHNAVIAQAAADEREHKATVKSRKRKVKPVVAVNPIAREIRSEWRKFCASLADTNASTFQYREKYIEFVVMRLFDFDNHPKCCNTIRKALDAHTSTVVKRAVEALMIEASQKSVSIENFYMWLDNKCIEVKREMVATGELKIKSGGV